ncbi:amidase family protein [Nocardia otitidiscaviarum]|uniref:amidase family protein n=1 Tax=Nocardia otitidiscaviarum TaxID=1823 RepID=UPI002B4B8824|nr:amidase family protein [Nocardia otitidiscaviarum]
MYNEGTALADGISPVETDSDRPEATPTHRPEPAPGRDSAPAPDPTTPATAEHTTPNRSTPPSPATPGQEKPVAANNPADDTDDPAPTGPNDSPTAAESSSALPNRPVDTTRARGTNPADDDAHPGDDSAASTPAPTARATTAATPETTDETDLPEAVTPSPKHTGTAGTGTAIGAAATTAATAEVAGGAGRTPASGTADPSTIDPYETAGSDRRAAATAQIDTTAPTDARAHRTEVRADSTPRTDDGPGTAGTDAHASHTEGGTHGDARDDRTADTAGAAAPRADVSQAAADPADRTSAATSTHTPDTAQNTSTPGAMAAADKTSAATSTHTPDTAQNTSTPGAMAAADRTPVATSTHTPGTARVDTSTAGAIAAAVRDGVLSPLLLVEEALARIQARDRNMNAFSVVRAEAARAEARAVAERADLDVLPLAGVPVAVKNNVDVAGEVTRAGSLAGRDRAAETDHPVVRRLRSAGAVVVGLTAVPEFGLWGTTDSPAGVTCNPWNPKFSAGGSSGGSGAAVGSGMVAVAHGNDGLGSVRIPAACCGVVGVKPGRGLVPAEIGVDSWGGMTENGVLATTVADAALMLSVLADRPDLADLESPPSLRIGLATAPPLPLGRVDRHWDAAARKAASAAATAGHHVESAELPYQGATFALMLRWVANAAREAATVAYPDRLQARTRAHIALGKLALRSGLLRPAQVDRIEARLLDHFERYDVVITPTLATAPPRARRWHKLPWLANVVANVRYSPFTPLWNLVGWPALSIPMGIHPRTGTPVAAQLIGQPGSEATLLRLAGQLESAHPWRRTAR